MIVVNTGLLDTRKLAIIIIFITSVMFIRLVIASLLMMIPTPPLAACT